MKNTIRVAINVSSREQSDLIMSALSDTAFYAFEESENNLNAYANEEDFEENLLISFSNEYSFSYSKHIIPSQNWNEAWEKSYEPVIVENFTAIRAPFHEPQPGIKHDIIITPKMSFGTGHHATTYLMVAAMKTIDFKNKTVLDFGTGTGILAILAEKSGASSITAVDNDEWSIANAKENADNNNCHKIKIVQAHTLKAEEEYDIILCNINLNVIIENADKIMRAGKKNTLILLSGFLEEDAELLETVFNKLPLTKTIDASRQNWVLKGFKIN